MTQTGMNEDLAFKLRCVRNRAMKHDEADTPTFKPLPEAQAHRLVERVKDVGSAALSVTREAEPHIFLPSFTD